MPPRNLILGGVDDHEHHKHISVRNRSDGVLHELLSFQEQTSTVGYDQQ